ncbi:hypothetical protein [Slackia exigua]|jgi:hypothetical protein|uniref:hypothetical protein n=1 Tax=Slackia exigua TaxID=84109 RepID=UPI0028DCC7F0|nr:hypothetical protein [Slackia exigua]
MAASFAKEIDYAYFAASLGWTYEQYGSCTPVQLLFIRKEIERRTVRDSDLLKDAVQVAVNNCLSKRKAKLWKRRGVALEIPVEEVNAMKASMEEQAPWTPWRDGGGDG